MNGAYLELGAHVSQPVSRLIGLDMQLVNGFLQKLAFLDPILLPFLRLFRLLRQPPLVALKLAPLSLSLLQLFAKPLKLLL